MDKQFGNLQEHFVYGKPQEHMTLDKISDDEIDCIIKGIKENKCQVVVLDNILSLAPQTAKGNITKFQKFIQSLKNNNISTIIIHHSTKGGESPKGPVELEALMQNIFRLGSGLVIFKGRKTGYAGGTEVSHAYPVLSFRKSVGAYQTVLSPFSRCSPCG